MVSRVAYCTLRVGSVSGAAGVNLERTKATLVSLVLMGSPANESAQTHSVTSESCGKVRLSLVVKVKVVSLKARISPVTTCVTVSAPAQ